MLSIEDQKNIWHPFTQEKTAELPIVVARAKDAILCDESGKEYWDLISSWWVNIHGHAHPKIVNAVIKQAGILEHVAFAGVTHVPAITLAKKLCSLLPVSLCRVFFSDNGSTSVEIALKMAYQYWYNQGTIHRRRFIAFDGGYHGDTFGAMSVGKSSGFYNPFKSFLFDVDIMPCPHSWYDDDNVDEKERRALSRLMKYLEKHACETAGLIIEPLIQGASGMQFFSEKFLRNVVDMVRKHEILVIFDEVMTGFGRTGKMFACLRAKVSPDIICLAKGLTGGFLPLAATVANEEIYKMFLSDSFSTALAHGHSYTANPIGCSAAIASLAIFEEEDTLAKIQNIEMAHMRNMKKLSMLDVVNKPRVMGTIAAFEVIHCSSGYNSPIGQKLKLEFLSHGLFLRPLGNIVYLLPPYCITPKQLDSIYEKIYNIIEKL